MRFSPLAVRAFIVRTEIHQTYTQAGTATTQKVPTLYLEDLVPDDEFVPGVNIAALYTAEAHPAQVDAGLTLRLSSALWFGTGEWDRVHYTVEVRTGITLQVDQHNNTLAKGAHVAEAIALKWARSYLMLAQQRFEQDIEATLLPELFTQAKTETQRETQPTSPSLANHE